MRFRLLSAALLFSISLSTAHAGTTIPFDADWRFTVGDPPGRRTAQFDDAGWSAVELPHDWSIAGPLTPEQSHPQCRRLFSGRGRLVSKDVQAPLGFRREARRSALRRSVHALRGVGEREKLRHTSLWLHAIHLRYDSRTESRTAQHHRGACRQLQTDQ